MNISSTFPHLLLISVHLTHSHSCSSFTSVWECIAHVFSGVYCFMREFEMKVIRYNNNNDDVSCYRGTTSLDNISLTGIM